MQWIAAEPTKPFLKWPGGKRWAAPLVSQLVRQRLGRRYFEPFLGGGAIYFHLRPRQAVLSDINTDLINTYRMVRDHVESVLVAIRGLPVSKKAYYAIRSSEPTNAIDRAARFLYLNR